MPDRPDPDIEAIASAADVARSAAAPVLRRRGCGRARVRGRVIRVTQDRELHAHTLPITNRYPRKKMMNCHYISTQLDRIQQARIGAAERLSIGGSSGLEEQLQAIELAILRIRDEMQRRERACAAP